MSNSNKNVANYKNTNRKYSTDYLDIIVPIRYLST